TCIQSRFLSGDGAPARCPADTPGRSRWPPTGLDQEARMTVKEKIGEAREPVAVPSTLRSHVLKQLRAHIVSGHYKPGERLNESRIARKLNISRIPIREALSQLQEQGLVTSHERRGMFVTKLSDQEVQQINSLRMVLEAEAMRLARARMTPLVLAELSDVVDQMENWDGPLIDARSEEHTSAL